LKVMGEVKSGEWLYKMAIPHEVCNYIDNFVQEDTYYEEDEMDVSEPVVVTDRVKVSLRNKEIAAFGTASVFVRKNNGKKRALSSSAWLRWEAALRRRNYWADLVSKKDVDLLTLKKAKPYLLTWQHGRRYINKFEPTDGCYSIIESNLLPESDESNFVDNYYYNNYDDYDVYDDESRYCSCCF